MASRVFFSFHYDGDIWRANQVRNSNAVAGIDVAGFFDRSEYEEAEKNGVGAIRRMILRNLAGTSVTVVLIGKDTANRAWVREEIKLSIGQNNGLRLCSSPLVASDPKGNLILALAADVPSVANNEPVVRRRGYDQIRTLTTHRCVHDSHSPARALRRSLRVIELRFTPFPRRTHLAIPVIGRNKGCRLNTILPVQSPKSRRRRT